jgi:C-terminal processing protease CtpA/Prc
MEFNKKDDRYQDNLGRFLKKRRNKTAFICLLLVLMTALIASGVSALVFYLMQIRPSASEKAYRSIKGDWLFADKYADFSSAWSHITLNPGSSEGADPNLSYEKEGTKAEESLGFSYDCYSIKESGGAVKGGLLVKDVFSGPYKEAGLQRGDVIVSVQSQNSPLTNIENCLPDSINPLFEFAQDETAKTVVYVRNGSEANAVCKKGISKRDSVFEEACALDSQGKACLALSFSDFDETEASDSPAVIANRLISKRIREYGYLSSLTLDLSGVKGSSFVSACALAGSFLPTQEILYRICDLNGNVSKMVKQTYFNYGVIYSSSHIKNVSLLVDPETSGPSEVLTLALKDGREAKVFGAKTKGNGLIRSSYEDKDYQGNVYGTLYYSNRDARGKNGEQITGKGLVPDYETNDYFFYSQDLVSHPYVAGSYELTNEEEQAVLKCLKKLPSYHEQTQLSSALEAFQKDEGISITGKYDVRTLYHLYGKMLSLYHEKHTAEILKTFI